MPNLLLGTEDNLNQRRYSNTKKTIVTTPLSTPISTAFFSNNVIQDFQENFDDEVDERSSEEYLRDLNIEYHERALLANSKRFIKRRNNFSSQKANENTECYKCGNKGHFARDCFSKTSDTLLDISPGIIYHQIKVNTLLSMDEDSDWQNYLKYINIDLKFVEEQRLNLLSKYNKIVFELHKCKDELLILKQAKLDAVTFQIQNTELTKLNHALQEQLKEEKKINEKWLTSSKKDWVERLNPDSKLPNFNTGSILVPESKAVSESLEPTETLNTHESSKYSKAESLTQLPPLKNLQGASPNSKVTPLTFQPHSSRERPGLGIMKHTKPETQDSFNKSVSGTVIMLIDEKVNSNRMTQESNSKTQKTESSKSVDSSRMSKDSKPKVQNTGSSKSLMPKPIQKPQLKPDDCRNYPECEICESYDHSTTGHNRVIHIRGGVLPESSQSNESLIETHQGAHLVPRQWMLKEYDWCQELSAQICKATRNLSKFTSPYTPEQNGVAERKNKTLIEAARTMLNGSVLSKHFWTEAVRIACYTQNRSIIVKRHDKTPYEISRERILDISYFYVFGCPVFIHNHNDHLSKFDAKADDGYFLGYSFVSKAFKIFNTRRQQVEDSYHVTFDESMEAIKFTNTLVDEIGIDDSSRYPPNEFQEDDPSRQYQIDYDVSYYIIPYRRSLIELIQENHVLEVIAPNEPEIPYTKDIEGPLNLINTEGTHEQNIQNDRMTTQSTDVSSGTILKFQDLLLNL
ncbi:retrovirus-related pol polyprotein from transposon TNT 1-94 [Tanacetum coccineum]